MEIITGIALGLSTLLFIGAVFFYLIKTTLISGKKAGISVAIGIILGDIIYVGLLLMGFSHVLRNPEFSRWFSGIGGILLIAMGIHYIIKKHNISEAIKTAQTSLWVHFTKGFVINFFNPFVIAVWIGFLAVVETKFKETTSVLITFGTILAVIFSTDILKVFFAQKLSKFFTHSLLNKMQLIVGVLLLLFGLKLIFHSIY